MSVRFDDVETDASALEEFEKDGTQLGFHIMEDDFTHVWIIFCCVRFELQGEKRWVHKAESMRLGISRHSRGLLGVGGFWRGRGGGSCSMLLGDCPTGATHSRQELPAQLCSEHMKQK